MTGLLRRSDAPHKSIRCYSLLSAAVKACSCWGSRALPQVMARICHQTSPVHGGTVKCSQAENSALQDWKGRARAAEVEAELSSALCLRDAVSFPAGAVALF